LLRFCGVNLGDIIVAVLQDGRVPPKWDDSALKRGIPKADVVYAIAHATFVDTIEDPGFRGGRVELYIGPEHGQTARE
jgi:hypothetical protein